MTDNNCELKKQHIYFYGILDLWNSEINRGNRKSRIDIYQKNLNFKLFSLLPRPKMLT